MGLPRKGSINDSKGYMDAYDEIYERLSEADSYEQPGPNWYSFAQRFQAVMREISIAQPHLVVDLGCADGIYCPMIAKLPADYLGADLVLTNLQRSKSRAKKAGVYGRVSLILCDILHLPFRPRSLRFIVCSETLEHLLDVDAALDEVATVLAGRIVITTPCFGGLFLETVLNQTVRRLTARLKDEIRSVGSYDGIIQLYKVKKTTHVNLFTPSILMDKLRGRGLSVTKVLGTAFNLPILPVQKRYKHRIWSRIISLLEESVLRGVPLFEVPILHFGFLHAVLVVNRSTSESTEWMEADHLPTREV